MLKLTKCIVNGQRALIGFMVKGKESEMGGFSSNEIERGFPIDSLIQTNFSNNQMSVVKANGKAKLVAKGNFKMNTLPMCVYAPGNPTGNDYIDIDNSIDLIGRFVQDNENIGFRVRFSDGTEDNLKYANVLMLSNWFRPNNFSIRTSSVSQFPLATFHLLCCQPLHLHQKLLLHKHLHHKPHHCVFHHNFQKF